MDKTGSPGLQKTTATFANTPWPLSSSPLYQDQSTLQPKTGLRTKAMDKTGLSELEKTTATFAKMPQFSSPLYRDQTTPQPETDQGTKAMDKTGYPGYTEHDGAHYKVVNQALAYNDAKRTCDADGGHLADIKTQELQYFLIDKLVDADRAYWIGLRKTSESGEWQWSDGTLLSSCSFTNWAPGKPNKKKAHCGLLKVQQGGTGVSWRDRSCSAGHRSFICQIEPVAAAECQEGNGASYQGTVAVTKTGRKCQHWSSQTPHQHIYTNLVHNYCRNPDGESEVWCFTTDPGTIWEYCDVPTCGKATLT
ncbi:uncharacterized protein LOC144863845 [Branchiostoma floridae x Branchiostoma japonicum]